MLGPEGKIEVMLALDVDDTIGDDTIGDDTDAFHKVMEAVSKSLEIGGQEMDNFQFKVLRFQTIWKKRQCPSR